MNSISRIRRDTFSNYSIVILRLVLSLLIVPIYLKEYGKELFGVYLLTFGFASSLSFLDFGSNKSLIRYTAVYHANRNKKDFEKALSASLSISLLSSLLVFIVIVCLGFFSEHLFKVNNDFKETTKLLFFLSAFYSVFFFVGLIPSTILQGLGIFHKRNMAQLIIIGLSVCVLAAVYFLHVQIVTFCILTILVNLFSAFIDIYLIKKSGHLKDVNIYLDFTKGIFQNDIFKYSFDLFLLSLIGFFSQQADNLILSSTIGFTAVTTYVIVTKPYYIFKGLNSNLYSVIQPIFVAEHENRNFLKIKKTIINLTKLVFAFSVTVTMFSIIFLKPFIEFWLNSTSFNAYLFWGYLALINLCLTSLFSPIFRYFYFTGHTRLIMRYDGVACLVNALVSIILCLHIGLGGVVVGTTLQMLIVLYGLSREAKKKLGIEFSSLYNFKFLTYGTVAGLITYFATVYTSYCPKLSYVLGLFPVVSAMVLFLNYKYLKSERVLSYLYK